MSLLSYLVTSSTRKDLLNLLWREQVETSAHQLALLANASYSVVHGELESMKREGLVSSYRKGKADIFLKNDGYVFKNMVLALLEMPKKSARKVTSVSDESVRSHLVLFGAPLVIPYTSHQNLSLEESLAYGLALARRDSNVARTLPVVFARNKNALNLNRLEYLARKNKVLNTLGFYLDLTSALSKNRKFHIFAQQLLDRRRKKLSTFFTSHTMSKYEHMLAEQNTPVLARKWHFLLNVGMDSFENLFKKNILEKRIS